MVLELAPVPECLMLKEGEENDPHYLRAKEIIEQNRLGTTWFRYSELVENLLSVPALDTIVNQDLKTIGAVESYPELLNRFRAEGNWVAIKRRLMAANALLDPIAAIVQKKYRQTDNYILLPSKEPLIYPNAIHELLETSDQICQEQCWSPRAYLITTTLLGVKNVARIEELNRQILNLGEKGQSWLKYQILYFATLHNLFTGVQTNTCFYALLAAANKDQLPPFSLLETSTAWAPAKDENDFRGKHAEALFNGLRTTHIQTFSSNLSPGDEEVFFIFG